MPNAIRIIVMDAHLNNGKTAEIMSCMGGKTEYGGNGRKNRATCIVSTRCKPLCVFGTLWFGNAHRLLPGRMQCHHMNVWKNSISTGTRAERITPLITESTTVSSLVQRIIMGSVVSSLVAPAGAMQVG